MTSTKMDKDTTHIEETTTKPVSTIYTRGQIQRNTNGQIPGHICGHTATTDQIPVELVTCDFCIFCLSRLCIKGRRCGKMCL